MTADPHDAVDRVMRLMRDSMHIDVDGTDVDLIETGVLDSLALVDLIFQIEQAFRISVRMDEVSIESFRTVRGIAELLTPPDDRRDPKP